MKYVKYVFWLISIIILLYLIAIFAEGGYGPAVALFVAPFAALGLAILWILVIGLGTVISEMIPKRAAPTSSTHYLMYAAWITVIMLILGLGLLANFILHGGPNKGVNFHVFKSEANPYLDMQIAISLIIISVSMTALIYVIKRANK